MHIGCHRTQTGDRMRQMEPQATGVTDGRKPGRLSPCVCRTLRMVSRAVTQAEDLLLERGRDEEPLLRERIVPAREYSLNSESIRRA